MTSPSDPARPSTQQSAPRARRTSAPELTAGVVIAGRYRTEHRIGGGSMGEVWVGDHMATGVPLAIKTLAPSAHVDHELIARFRREAQLLGRIRSDSVARVIDFLNDDTYGLVLVMEFVSGDSLGSVLAERQLSVEEAIDLGIDIARALCHLHRAHVVHRDLKPSNVILEPIYDGKHRAVLVDFGASRMLSSPNDEGPGEDTLTGITRIDMAIGTVEYMAPEQVLNSRDVTTACDTYALGAILYRAVAGRHVYGSLSEGKLVRAKLLEDAPALESGRSDGIARGLAAFVARALKRKAHLRYPSAEEMVRELETLQELARANAAGLDDPTTVQIATSASLLLSSQPSDPFLDAVAAPVPTQPTPLAVAASSVLPLPEPAPRRSTAPYWLSGVATAVFAIVMAAVVLTAGLRRARSSGRASPGTATTASAMAPALPPPGASASSGAAPSVAAPTESDELAVKPSIRTPASGRLLPSRTRTDAGSALPSSKDDSGWDVGARPRSPDQAASAAEPAPSRADKSGDKPEPTIAGDL